MSEAARDTDHRQQRCRNRFDLATLLAKWLAIASCLLWLAPTAMAQTLSQTELQKLLGSELESGDEFGYSVALSGDRALVGAYSDNDNGTNAGAAYVYERDEGGVWSEVAKLTASDGFASDRFGWSVSLSGSRALVGSVTDDDGAINAGSAYIYERDEAGVWEAVAKLTASDAAREDLFGWSVSISGDRALIGANLDDDADTNSGVGAGC